MLHLVVVKAAVFGLMLVACTTTPSAPRGMVLAPAASPTPGAIVVAFPKSACTGTGNAVFMDDAGAFVSAVAPGTAAYVTVPAGRLFMVSNFDVEAGPGTRFFRHPIPKSTDNGIILDVPRRDGRNCSGRGLPRPGIVPSSEALAAAQPLVWLAPDPAAGAQWFDAHRPRIQEMLGAAATNNTE